MEKKEGVASSDSNMSIVTDSLVMLSFFQTYESYEMIRLYYDIAFICFFWSF